MGTFQLTITLGNAEMQHPWFVARALRDVADAVEGEPSSDNLSINGGIRDINGNTVGSYAVLADGEQR